MLIVGDPGRGRSASATAERRRRPGPDRVHHHRRHRGPPDGAARTRSARRPGGARGDRGADARVREIPTSSSCDASPRGSGVIAAAFFPQGRHRPPLATSRPTSTPGCWADAVRADGGESDARLPRRLALLDPRYATGFALECRAMRRVRDDMGLRNVKVMIPFCRTLEEGAPRARRDGGATGCARARTGSRST